MRILFTVMMVVGLSAPVGVGLEASNDAAVFVEHKVSPREFAKRASRSSKEYECLLILWDRESHWNPKADNPRSTAFGIAQMLNEKSKDPITQVKHGLVYIKERYRSACAALAHSTRFGWY